MHVWMYGNQRYSVETIVTEVCAFCLLYVSNEMCFICNYMLHAAECLDKKLLQHNLSCYFITCINTINVNIILIPLKM